VSATPPSVRETLPLLRPAPLDEVAVVPGTEPEGTGEILSDAHGLRHGCLPSRQPHLPYERAWIFLGPSAAGPAVAHVGDMEIVRPVASVVGRDNIGSGVRRVCTGGCV
jgi:hypothetical protein